MNWQKYVILGTLILLCTSTAHSQSHSPAEVLRRTGVKGGLIVHVGCGDGRLTAALCAGDGFLVHGLDSDAANVTKARTHIRLLGLYGKASADVFNGKRLPYVDDLVNLLVISKPFSCSSISIMRFKGCAAFSRSATLRIRFMTSSRCSPRNAPPISRKPAGSGVDSVMKLLRKSSAHFLRKYTARKSM